MALWFCNDCVIAFSMDADVGLVDCELCNPCESRMLPNFPIFTFGALKKQCDLLLLHAAQGGDTGLSAGPRSHLIFLYLHRKHAPNVFLCFWPCEDEEPPTGVVLLDFFFGTGLTILLSMIRNPLQNGAKSRKARGKNIDKEYEYKREIVQIK